RGFSEFDSQIQVAGVICNRVAGLRHYRYLEYAIRRNTDVCPVGWLPRRPDWQISERHLGLTTIQDQKGTAELWASLAEAIGQTIDLDRLLALSANVEMQASDVSKASEPFKP